MTEGTSQGLFIVVAIVIFGIFVSLSYTLFGKTLQPQMNAIFTEATEQVSYKMQTAGNYNPTENTDAVIIQDAVLQRAIRNTLKLEKDAVITVSDMENLTKLEANFGSKYQYQDLKITSLNGLEYATNLTELWMHGNSISDLKPITDLTELKTINMNANEKIKDIEPLRKLSKLSYVMLQDNLITNLEPLEDKTDIVMLNIGQNPIKSINNLYRLTKISQLYIDRTEISDISILSNFKSLNLLWAYETNITDFSNVEHIKTLVTVKPPKKDN